jgi:hypothetical protein
LSSPFLFVMKYFLFFLIFSGTAFAQNLDFAHTPAWLKLLHYQKSIFGYKSQADGKEFFLSSDGKTNPKAELKAYLDEFAKNPEIACQFPARYLRLKKIFGLKDFDLKTCKKFDEFFVKMGADSASLVFSNYFLDTPASAFGHTLLIFHQPKSKTLQESDLLDYGVNYAADMTTNNALIYAFKGLSGGFRGIFTSIPYYYKIREYNDYESRDLFIYRLNLTKEDVEFMVAHLWELGQTYFDYYYLTENCSYHVLALIESARPEFNLLSNLPFYIIPIDTVKALFREHNLVKTIDYRPALRTKILNKLEQTSKSDFELAKKLSETQNSDLIKEKDNGAKAKIIDFAIDLFDYYHAKELLMNNQFKEEKRNLTLLRSEIPLQSHEEILVPKQGNTPHLSHPSQRLSLGGGRVHNQDFIQTEMRFAIHDLLDPPEGQAKNLHLEFAKVRFKYFAEDQQLKIDELSIFEVFNFSPWSVLSRPLSWRVNMGGKTVYDETCNTCFAFNTELSGGYAFNLDHAENFRVLLMGDVDVNAAKSFQKNPFRVGFGPSLWLYSTFNPKFLMLNQVGYRHYEFTSSLDNLFSKNEFRYHVIKDFSLGIQANFQTIFNEYSGNVFYYF